MNLFFSMALILFCFDVSAKDLAYVCNVFDPSNSGAKDKQLRLSAEQGKMVDSVSLQSKKHFVQVELYFSNIQIHISNASDGALISSASAPERTKNLNLSLSGVTSVTCVHD